MTKPTILIVDDDAEVCEEIAAGLQRHNYPVEWTTLPSGMFVTGEFRADIVVLDLSMPNIDGFEVIDLLAEFGQKPQLIIASGHSDRIIAAAIRSAGALGLTVLGGLEKPYSIETLIGLLSTYQPATDNVTDLQLVHRAVADGDIKQHMRVAFQSKRRLKDDAIVGYEALARLSIGRPVNPEIAFSEAVPLQVQLMMTDVVLDEAMGFAAGLARCGQILPIAVNCSPQILCATHLMKSVASSLERHDTPSSSLLIELTEHNSLNSLDDIAAAAARLALRGVRLVVDDFGRGSTSYEKLLHLPLAEVKIDKDIFWMAMTGKIAVGMLQEIIAFCRRHNMRTTIEGIETAAHCTAALALGADYGQGYFWDRPAFREHIMSNAPARSTQLARA